MSLHRFALLCPLLLALAACSGDDPVRLVDECDAVSLPLAGNDDAPVIVQAALEVQPSGIVPVATAIDPQGSADLEGVQQAIGVFTDWLCNGQPFVVRDDLASSGMEETFGTAVSATTDPQLFAAIATSNDWPVEFDFRDASGNRTTGRVRLPIRQ